MSKMIYMYFKKQLKYLCQPVKFLLMKIAVKYNSSCVNLLERDSQNYGSFDLNLS